MSLTRNAKPLLLCFVLLGLAAWPGDMPELCAGLRGEPKELTAAFNARVQSNFLIGISVEEIAENLEDDGFTVERKKGFAVFREYSRSCYRNWMVRWGRKQGIVTSREGAVGHVCR